MLVITDIDGTLFSHNLKKIPDSAVDAIKKLQAKLVKWLLN